LGISEDKAKFKRHLSYGMFREYSTYVKSCNEKYKRRKQ